MRLKKFIQRTISIILATSMACGTIVGAAEADKTSGLASVGSWFAERGKEIKEGASDAGAWIGDNANKAWEATSDVRQSVGDAANSAWNTTVNTVTDTGKWVGNNANKAWNSTVEIAVDVGTWMGSTASTAWGSTEDARIWIGEKTVAAWNSTTESIEVAGAWVSENVSSAWDNVTSATDATGKWICDTAGEIQVVSADALDSTGQWLDEKGKELVFFTSSTGEVVAAYVEDIDKDEVVDYLARSGEKIILGEYSDEDPTLLSIGGTLAASVVNLDMGMDIRDIVYGVQHLDSDEVEISDIALSAVGLIPIIGVIKPAKKFLDAADAVSTMAKMTDDVVDVAKTAEVISDAGKAVDNLVDVGKVAEAASDTGKVLDVTSDSGKVVEATSDIGKVTDDISDAANIVGRNADEVADVAGDAIKYTDTVLDTLKNTDDFADDAIDHIFKGALNKSGRATGYHYEGIEDTIGEVIPGTRSVTDGLGVYTADVTVGGTKKNGFSSFFPENMEPQKIIDSINEAYENRDLIPGTDKYVGVASNGLEIQMYLDNFGKIKSAFPVWKGRR